MPPKVLSTFANGLLMGKILSSCSVTLPVRLGNEERSSVVIEEINKCIKSTARIITKTRLSDKVRSENVLCKANSKCLNEAVASIMATTVWKAKQSINPLGKCLFKETVSLRTRSASSDEIRPPVPGYPNLATNIMARVWNTIPELHNASTLYTASSILQKWAKSIPR